MTDPDDPFLPAELNLGEDDVVETVEKISGHDGVGTRREGRERALALLFEAEQRGIQPPAQILAELPLEPEPFARTLVEGVSEHLEEIDAVISRRSVAWPLERMPAIDRCLLRMGTFELAYSDVPIGVCISEGVELAKRYSTDESHKFLNGMLAAIGREVRPMA